MSLKVTLALVLAALVVGVVVYVNPFKKKEAAKEAPPWFYQVAMDDIALIQIQHQDKRVKFTKTKYDTWAFEEPAGIPPSLERWGGITLLLSGPQTRRDLTIAAPTIENPAQYGLDAPATIVDVGLTYNRSLQFRLGDTTTDGSWHYGQVIGFEQLFLISSSWGDVLARLSSEPPYPKWYVKRDPKEVVEVNIYLGDPLLEETPLLRFTKEEDAWSVRDFVKDDKPLPVDNLRWAAVLPILGGPPNVSVVVPKVEDQDYTPYGISSKAKVIELRFSSLTPRGITYLEGVGYQVGSKIPDRNGYYGKWVSDDIIAPVLHLDAAWVETLLALYDNIPYGAKPTPQASTATN